ncbi:hypothetical protein SAMN05519103_06124 [Rhizobiales bacterium GAS113]|nr:hypothetical protein SAMN05519103_06124 [Rhizobiales bacterium GAS113]
MDTQTRTRSRTIAHHKTWADESRLKRRLLIAGLSLALVGVALLGVLRLFQSLNDGTINTWRLVMLFANAFSCIIVVCALCARGRAPRPPRNFGRRRS